MPGPLILDPSSAPSPSRNCPLPPDMCQPPANSPQHRPPSNLSCGTDAGEPPGAREVRERATGVYLSFSAMPPYPSREQGPGKRPSRIETARSGMDTLFCGLVGSLSMTDSSPVGSPIPRAASWAWCRLCDTSSLTSKAMDDDVGQNPRSICGCSNGVYGRVLHLTQCSTAKSRSRGPRALTPNITSSLGHLNPAEEPTPPSLSQFSPPPPRTDRG